MDRPTDEQGHGTEDSTVQSVHSANPGPDDSSGKSTEGTGDERAVGDDVKPSWVHDQKLAPNPVLKDFLLSLRVGLEKMVDMEKAKIEEMVQAKNRMGGR